MSAATELVAQCAALATPSRRLTSRARRIQFRDQIADVIRPHMGETWQWLQTPRHGESETTFARRAAEYAAMRANLAGSGVDAAAVASVAAVLRAS